MKRIMSFIEAARLFKEVWRLYKKYSVRQLEELELENLTSEAKEIYNTYKCPFAKELVIAVENEINRTAGHYEKL